MPSGDNVFIQSCHVDFSSWLVV